MSGRTVVRDAVRTAQENKGTLGVGGVLVVVLGALLGRLAGNRRAIPPVRATGVAENAVFPPDQPPRDR